MSEINNPGVGEGSTDHAALSNLAYANAGHTGFQPAGTYLVASDIANLVPYTGATGDVALGVHNITAANLAITNWNTAYGWGNHASAGYLTSVTAHNLLSTTHGDTLADSVIRGDILIGNSTPKWSRLPVGVNGTFLTNDGTDVKWSSLKLPSSTTAPSIFVCNADNIMTTLAPTTTANRVLKASSGVISWTLATGAGSPVLATGPTLSSPHIDKIADLTTNGFVKTSGSDGTLSVDTSTYLTGNQSISLSGAVTGSGTTAITTTLATNIVGASNMKGASSTQLANGSAGNLLKSLGDGTFGWDTSTYLTSLSGALLATGATTGATSQAQVFTNGVKLSNLTPGRVALVGTAGIITDSSKLTFSDTGLVVSGIASNLPFSVSVADGNNGYWAFSRQVGYVAGFLLRTSGVNRWLLSENATAEGGSNAGSDFAIFPCNDAGDTQASAFFIKRSTGFVGIGGSSSLLPDYPLTVYGTINLPQVRVAPSTNTIAASDYAELMFTMQANSNYPGSIRLIAKNASGGYLAPRLGFFLVPENNYTYASMVERLTITGSGSVIINNGAIATNATDGFLYIPTCAGTPTGTPTTYTGRCAMVMDTTNHKLYVYDGSWIAMN